MKKVLFLLPLLAAGMTPAAAFAEETEAATSDITVSGSVGLASQYRLRGISLSDEDKQRVITTYVGQRYNRRD